ncbi:fungal-specific transcription factor domain-containing protein [Aspergillus aurantiobrunneus]
MMVNRLETNIARMEAHFQDLGFDLGNQGKAQAVPQPSAPENLHPPPSPCVSESENVLEEGLWRGESIPKSIHGNLEEPHANTFSDIEYQGCDASDLHEVEEGPFPDEFGGLLIPRCMLDTTNARALPILSHEGVEWMSRKSGVTPRLSSDKHRNATSFGVLDEDFPRKVFCPLPSTEEALSLLHEYLQNFNSLCPLFQQAKLVSLFNQDRLDVAFHKPPFWACANVVFALGIAFRIKNGNVAQSEHQRSWLFIENAFGSFHDLCLGQPDLWSIQAFLGMSLFFLGTMSAEPCCFLATAAIRMSHQIGLGKREQDVTLAPEDLEHRRNIFWIAYCLDREISLRFGKPPTQSDDDMTIGLPTELPTDSSRIMPPLHWHSDFNAFRAQCQLATIKGQLYKDLYSAAAKDRPLSEIIASVKTLDEMLQSWRKDLPLDYQPESRRLPNFHQSSLSVTLLYLHCSYFNCIIAMYRLIAGRGIRTAEDLVKIYENLSLSTPLPYAPALFASESLCANAARASIKLMKYMPQGHISLVGILIHYPIVALATLSSTIIRNPLNASRLTDMMLIDQVDTFLSSLVVSIPNQAIGRLRAYCAKYRAAAKAAVQNTMQYCGI